MRSIVRKIDESRGAVVAGPCRLEHVCVANPSFRVRLFCSHRGWGWYRVPLLVALLIRYV